MGSTVHIPKNYAFLAGGLLVGLAGVWLWYRSWNRAGWDLADFDSPDEPGSGNCMDAGFLKKLSKARRIARLPFIITSGYRSLAHNAQVGGVSNSAHRHCLAADISAPFEWMRDRMVWAAVKAGFTRIGMGKTFIHLDMDASKPQFVAWGYPVGSPPPFDPFGAS